MKKTSDAAELESDSPSTGGEPKSDAEQGHQKLGTIKVLESGTGKRERAWLDDKPTE